MTKSVGTGSKSTILMQSIWTLTSNSLAFLYQVSRIQLLPEFLKAQRIAASDMRRNCSVALGNVNISKNRYTDLMRLEAYLTLVRITDLLHGVISMQALFP
ncbi:hypothetical protein SDJN02_09402, partial [Cucurbita argyrosperma subsp. argyrosperma]